ncbi:4-diphosphocytidyl-2-C-methyl-D-erythritol kinase [Candidatus Terasakiella magnetica]|uniref:4-diphosphocytidyl-2-C-methyl-D-erythritol kinase n=1 Tax=Candidatus Terasakiella magnetica TaxID=1867952 RepID=A0A1C3REJ7_9PROT|nr:4-(cytidine 5'-diphospho)-2-C-methyl-D-erythritol kinase [Candidatus Terasakiella magnetica]SCA55662.1 4-diphosphocytidyl-2-C-methyl-D-erythritol kinase [Candidatus Terasakiella magnetica]
MTITREAFAKVNLYLHVCGRRDNGYHELDSLIVFAQTGDILSFEEAEDITLEVSGPMAPFLDGEPADNLVLKAAHGLRALSGLEKGARITLDKRLPVAAGIGGGSGDGAAALKGLCELWQIFPDPMGLEELALSLGADVPICMKAHANHVAGIGEKITPLPPLPDCWMVLVNPMVAVSTPAVFKARTAEFSPAAPMGGEYGFEGFIEALKERQNDLMAPAMEIAPEIKPVLEAISAQPACRLSRMSGSGATCFGLFEHEEAAKEALDQLKSIQPSWWVSLGKII